MNHRAGVLACSWLLWACGGTSEPSDARGGAGGAGGGGSQAEGGKAQAGQTQSTGAADASESGAGGEASSGPPAQGAAIFSVKPASPQPVGKACPSTAFTASIPDTSMTPTEALDDDNYRHNVIDGQDGATVACRVAPSGGWVFEGEVRLGAKALRLEGGELPVQGNGSATISISDSTHLTAALTSSEPCVVSAMPGTGNLQIKAGSMWASFRCAAVEQLPSSSCAADGYFVLENCQQD